LGIVGANSAASMVNLLSTGKQLSFRFTYPGGGIPFYHHHSTHTAALVLATAHCLIPLEIPFLY